MTVDSFQIAFVSVTLLLPGYIASLVLSARRARRREATEIEFFRWLALGAVCNAPWIVLSFLAAGDELRSDGRGSLVGCLGGFKIAGFDRSHLVRAQRPGRRSSSKSISATVIGFLCC